MFSKIQLLSAIGALSMASVVSAHGHVMSWVIDGTAHAGYNPDNPTLYGATAERPTMNKGQGFTDYTSGIVACGGTDPGTGIQNLDIKGGSKVVAKWDTWPTSHKGPITQWMANCGAPNCNGIDAASLDWFKISEDGFDGTLWAGEKLGNTKEWAFEIPSDLASGAYLVRHDVLAMHTTGQPQVYPYCFQANLESSGSVVPSLTTTFPAAYQMNTDFLTWSLYGGDQSLFVAPGPAVYSGGGTAPAPAPSASASSAVPSASAQASSSAAVSSASTPVASSSVVVVPSASATATEEYPAEPTVSTPTESEPVVSSSAPVASSSAPVESASASSASSAPATPSASTPATPAPGGAGAMGGAAPPITEDGTRFKVNGGSYNSRSDAVYASCMLQMNACKNWANSLPNAEVGAAFSSCDTQVSTCTSSSKKRDVVNRYAKRSLWVL